MSVVPLRNGLKLALAVFTAILLIAGCSGGGESDAPPSTAPPSSGGAGDGSGTAATDTVISLAWQPNADTITGYLVYYGPSANAVSTLAVQLAIAGNSFNPLAPQATFNAGRDLGLHHGESICFRLRAYNGAGMSDWSAAACGTV